MADCDICKRSPCRFRGGRDCLEAHAERVGGWRAHAALVHCDATWLDPDRVVSAEELTQLVWAIGGQMDEARRVEREAAHRAQRLTFAFNDINEMLRKVNGDD